MKKIAFILSGLLLLNACTKNKPEVPVQEKSLTQKEKTLVIIGDSLTEGYGIAQEKAYPFLLEKRFGRIGKDVVVLNSGISGSTSASASERMTWALKSKPDLIVLALGANDGLRGLPVSSMKKNLGEAIDIAQKAGVKVALFGMLMPPNFGAKYGRDYEQAFKDLAKEKNVPLLPFLLKDVAGNRTLNLNDGVHPNEKGHEIMTETTFPFLKDLI